MAVGGALVAGVLAWVCADLVVAIGGARPEHGRSSSQDHRAPARFGVRRHRRLDDRGSPRGDPMALAHGRWHPVDSHHSGSDLRPFVDRSQCRRRFCRPARPRICRVSGLSVPIRPRISPARLPIQPPFILNPFWIIPFAIVAAMLCGVPHPDAYASSSRRLPRDSHPGLRRDHRDRRQTPWWGHRRTGRYTRGHPAVLGPLPVGQICLDGDRVALLLPDLGGGGPFHCGVQLPRAFTGGPVVDGYSRR